MRAALAERITHCFHASGRTYGSPRITLDLWAEGCQVSQNTVAKVITELGLQGRKPPASAQEPDPPGQTQNARDLVLRHFDAITPTCCGEAT